MSCTYDMYFCPLSLKTLSVKMNRVQKEFVFPNKKARPQIVCVGVVYACTVSFHIDLFLPCLKALDCLNLLATWPIPPPSGIHNM